MESPDVHLFFPLDQKNYFENLYLETLCLAKSDIHGEKTLRIFARHVITVLTDEQKVVSDSQE